MGRLDDLEAKAMTLEEYKALSEKEKRQLVAEEYGDVPRKEEPEPE